jgi:Dyp-type peroxidase family
MAEPQLNAMDIQGDILVGLIKKNERLVFFTITDPDTFRSFLRELDVTSTVDVLAQQSLIDARRAAGIRTLVPTPGLNVAFTWSGLRVLGLAPEAVPDDPELTLLAAGMAGSRETLADPPADDWEVLGPDQRPDGVFVVTGSSEAEIANVVALRLAPAGRNGFAVVHEEVGQVRPDPVAGHEHFGFADGVSQPGVRGEVAPGTVLTPRTSPDPDQGAPGQDLLWPGEFVFGYPGQDGSAASFTVEGPVTEPPLEFMADGAFMAFRNLEQKVPEFDLAVKAGARAASTAAEPLTAELLGAQLIGRWKSGAPLIKAPFVDDPKIADGTPLVNDFEFGDDRDGLVCPWAAHVRKTYPRDDVRGEVAPDEPTVKRAEAFTQTHRMLRRGIAYGEELTAKEAISGASDPAHRRGLLFKCYVTSLSDQFEFVQAAWANNPDFVQPGSGRDAVIGQPNEASPFLGAAPHTGDPARKPTVEFRRFVHMRGGEYFFAPSIAVLKR